MNLKEIYKIFCENPKICTDSRKITPGCIFFALKGEIYNGNKFAKAAINKGAKYAIIDDEKFLSKKTILVNDTKRALQELAKYHRNQINIPLIGITGTNGKTTTKELLYTILSKKYKTYATKGNLNSQIGLPLSILEIASYHEIAVIEMGADRIGEIKNLCEIAKPNSGIITNIGKAHLEGFGSFEGVIKAKTELYDFLKKNNGVQFVNGDDNLLVKKSRRKNSITYGKETKSNFLAKLTSSFPFVSIKIKDTAIESHLVGKFQYDNIVAASCIGSFYNVSLENIKKSIESYIPKNNRTELIETKNNHIILDAYNANPSSMESMIDSFIKLNKQKKMCILGEMRELGSYSEKEHLKLIKKMKTSGLESIFIGKEYLNLFTENKSTWKYNNWNINLKDVDLVDETEIKNIKKNIFLSTADLIENISDYDLKNRTILIKGSRGLCLENIVKYL